MKLVSNLGCGHAAGEQLFVLPELNSDGKPMASRQAERTGGEGVCWLELFRDAMRLLPRPQIPNGGLLGFPKLTG
jgi:hypothetical protein